MDTYNNLKTEILKINRDVSKLFSTAKSIPSMSDYSFGEWEKTCEHLPRQFAEDTIRVAIVGPIKSGKSTFLNSIFKGEYVKRGAGVITSIVTRVRKAQHLQAKLYFKSWSEINAEMEQAMVLFPSMKWRSDDTKIDIRQEKDRQQLLQALGELSADQLFTKSSRNINSVILSSYLKGYDVVQAHVTAENAVKSYEGDRFVEHKAFVGNETLAVYLKDVLLEISSDNVQSNIEIADCQGSDSSNPLHLAMIQDYLLLTHQIIYVVSSRTGLREADIRFLSMIKKMGISENIVFVVNFDFSEHESIEDLKSLVNRVREELSMLKPDPDVYTFSALYNLFSTCQNSLSDKDKLRFEQWQADGKFVELSNRETTLFESFFYDHLARKRYALLMKNHIERLGVILSGIADWIGVNQEVLEQDAENLTGVLKKIRSHQQRLDQIKAAIKKTLNGALAEIKKELQRDTHRFFNGQSGNISGNLENFVQKYAFSSEKYQKSLKNSDFSQVLYLVFQEFKQSIDAYITESINPEVVRFLHSREKRIREYFSASILPFDTMIDDAYGEFNRMIGRSGFFTNGAHPLKNKPAKVETVISGKISPPPLVTAMHYSTKIKTEAIMRLGVYRIRQNIMKLFKKSDSEEDGEKLLALKDAIRRIKRETGKSLEFHLKDYRENLKFSYLFKLAEATSESYTQTALDRFQVYFSDLSGTTKHIGTSQSDKAMAVQILKEMDQVSRQLNEKLDLIRDQIVEAS
ncbi:MAG: dynamin family protein [Desulfobacterales bacterium]|jgi:GTPase SAR1 family protein